MSDRVSLESVFKKANIFFETKHPVQICFPEILIHHLSYFTPTPNMENCYYKCHGKGLSTSTVYYREKQLGTSIHSLDTFSVLKNIKYIMIPVLC